MCYPTNHLVPYLASTLPASLCLSLPLYLLSQASSPSLSCPILLCQLCCPQLAHPHSYPVVCHRAPLCPLISACFHPCPLTQASPALLLTSLLFILPHPQLQHPPSSLSFPNLRFASPTYFPTSLLLLLFPSASPSICSLLFPHFPSQPLCLPYYILRRPQIHTSLCGC